MKGVAERSSVFASKIFTAIPPIPAPYNNSDKQNASKRIGYIELPLLFFSKYENNKEK